MDKKELGKIRIKEILGSKAEEIIANFESISPDFANYILTFAYGELYARPNFSDKWRELAAVSNLIGQRNTGLALKSHFKGMLNVGWKKEEIIELILFLISYVGFPTCVEALLTLKELTEQISKKNKRKNSA